MSLLKPKVRPVESIPVEVDGDRMFMLRDPAEVSTPTVVSEPVLFLIALMDGRRDAVGLQAAFAEQFGEILEAEDLRRVLANLDERLLLEGGRFERRMRDLREAFSKAPIRASSCAGATYPEDPEELGTFLDEVLQTAPDLGSGSASSALKHGPIRALLAPHIDYQRGGPTYAKVYGELARDAAAEVFVILGVAHKGGDGFFSLTRKDYGTPLGTARTDGAFVDALARRVGGDPFADEFSHRSEHSIELQIVLLQRLFGGLENKTIVPILCGSIHPAILAGKPPIQIPEFRTYIEALRQTLEECGKRWTVIAAVDLAHVGGFFGGPEELTPQYLSDLEAADREMLGHVERMDSQGFFEDLEKDENARSVCGALPIYAVTELLRPGEVRLLEYRQCVTPEIENCVTIAGMVIY